MRQVDLAADIGVWLWRQMKDAGADGYVVGLSGGIDSALAAKLAVMGVGLSRVHCFYLDCGSMSSDLEAISKIQDWLGYDTIDRGAFISLTPHWQLLMKELFNHDIAIRGAPAVAMGNLKARLRMATLYYYANSANCLVLGTGNRSELELGYFTKYGDGGVDVLPLGDLLKYEVKCLARELDMPEEIIDQPPSAGLWEGQTDEDEMGVTYESVDFILDSGGPFPYPSDEDRIRVAQMHEVSQHKREMPPIYRRV